LSLTVSHIGFMITYTAKLVRISITRLTSNIQIFED
jgi:hypothetical protein